MSRSKASTRSKNVRKDVESPSCPFCGILTIRGHWLSLILSGLKTCEIQVQNSKSWEGGLVGLCCSKTGKMFASARIKECRCFPDVEELITSDLDHMVPADQLRSYAVHKEKPRSLYAYILSEVRVLATPLNITKKSGSTIFSKPTAELVHPMTYADSRFTLAAARQALLQAGANLRPVL